MSLICFIISYIQSQGKQRRLKCLWPTIQGISKEKMAQTIGWQRVYDTPQVNIGNYVAKKVDPWDNKQFVNRTGNMKGTYGDLQDYSAQMSEKRAKESITGEDPMKRKHFDKYEKNVQAKNMLTTSQKLLKPKM